MILLINNKFKPILFLVLFLLSPFPLHAQITLTAIDVGQGDAVLIQHESYAVLIDGGRPGNLVADYLRDQGRWHFVWNTQQP